VRVTAFELAERLQNEQRLELAWAQQHFETIDDGHFIAVAVNDYECTLVPYPEFAATIYRGQNEHYEPCLSSLYRTPHGWIDRLIAGIRIVEFQLLLSEHPAVVDFCNWSVMGHRLRIDYEGLAQHYHLETELIDFTSNPLVAVFFACCEYSKDSREYRPIMRAEKEGVIYTFNAAAEISTRPEESYLSAVGLQPLPRPAEQYAWGYRLPGGASLNSRPFVLAFSFAHDPKSSVKIFEYFEGGTKLFPLDPVENKARQLAAANRFSKEAFLLALTRCGESMEEQFILNALHRKGVEIVDVREIMFTETEKAEMERKWIERRDDLNSRIHWRRVCYPE
jgi:hypothetical protein